MVVLNILTAEETRRKIAGYYDQNPTTAVENLRLTW